MNRSQKHLLILSSMLPLQVVKNCAKNIEDSKHYLFLGLETFQKNKSQEMLNLINYQMSSIDKSIHLLEKRLKEASELLEGI